MSRSHPVIITPEELPIHMEGLLAMVESRSKYMDTALRVRGPVYSGSLMGQLYKLQWVTFESECANECWVLGCPAPDTHVRVFTITRNGRAALASLQAKPTTRGCDD